MSQNEPRVVITDPSRTYPIRIQIFTTDLCGSGYENRVTLTPDQATAIAHALTDAAEKCRKVQEVLAS